MKFLFNKSKSEQIKSLTIKNCQLERDLKSIKYLCSYKKDDYEDFISILHQIQNTNNENLQWKKKQCIINNEINLAIENYENKIEELKQ